MLFELENFDKEADKILYMNYQLECGGTLQMPKNLNYGGSSYNNLTLGPRLQVHPEVIISTEANIREKTNNGEDSDQDIKKFSDPDIDNDLDDIDDEGPKEPKTKKSQIRADLFTKSQTKKFRGAERRAAIPPSAIRLLASPTLFSQRRHYSQLVKSNGKRLFLIDTLALVRRLEVEGLPSKQAEAITAAMTEILNDSLENVSLSVVSNTTCSIPSLPFQ
ncbi:uncharacterized protein LOC105784537 [Gossypium raimondii]|uniref:uncharacterized protein LOC105784537 n=1 Tax=Gossypium raimondii TaxID=29730 RepID=UPI00227C7EDE|nr:uncharacterized protein LOC105784537 [Gossypium raimondii]